MAVSGHEPERTAAAYLGGRLGPRRRRAFERHIVDCEDCWREVDLARRGRSLAEAARELAPHSLREQIRASVWTVPVRRRWLRVAAIAGVVAAAAVGGGVVTLDRDGQPEVIEAALSAAHGEWVLPETRASTLPVELGDLRLIEARGGSVQGLELTQHLYRDAAGHVVSVLQAARPFPAARGAVHRPDGHSWTVTVGGVVLFCADRPTHVLVAGDDAGEVALAVRLLELG